MSLATKEQQEQLDNALFKKLEQLTMKIPSDPNLYLQDVLRYSKMFQQQFQKLLTDIQRKNQRFSQLLIFLSRCVKHFTKQLSYVPKQVIELLKNHGPNLHSYVRKKCVGSIMILRAKNILFPVQTIQFLLTLFNIEDKQLRKILYKYILNDIKRMNKHHKNIKINQQIRNFIYECIVKNGDKMTQKSLKLMIELYKRNIWTDNRCVNIIAEGCFNQSSKIRLISAHFLISTTQPLEQLEESDQQQPVNPAHIKRKKGITKNTKNKQKQIEKQKKRAQRRLRKKQIQGRKVNFMPIDIIYSPQDFAEKLFNFTQKKNTKFSHKLVYMALISRLIWRHRLIILPWYGSLVKYMQPKQKQVHKVLTYFAESVHQNLPDDQIQTVVKHIIQKFVNDRCSQFAMTIGLNTIREVYAKLSSIITEQSMLYLSTYYEYKNKNVRAAAKALINLVRQINPYLLQKKYRGRAVQVDSTKVSKDNVKTSIDGAELLDHKGDIPIYMDQVLTDEDFKKIRKLKRRQQQQKQLQHLRMLQQSQQHDNDEQDQQNQADEQISNYQNDQEQDDEQQIQDQQDQSDEQGQQQQIDWGDCQQLQDYVEGEQDQENQVEGQEQGDDVQMSQQQGDQQQEQEQEQGSDQQMDQDDDGQQIQSVQPEKTKKVRGKNKKIQKQEDFNSSANSKKIKNKKQIEVEQYSDEDEDDQIQEQEQDNPHGFLSPDAIGFYKKSKTQIKSQKRRTGQKKEKFKHKPKQKKGGGSSNKQKQKLKPLLMLRAKKNKIRSQQKQVKIKIKNLKQQLGRVKSGKQAKKLKNKKIFKKPKRR